MDQVTRVMDQVTRIMGQRAISEDIKQDKRKSADRIVRCHMSV